MASARVCSSREHGYLSWPRRNGVSLLNQISDLTPLATLPNLDVLDLPVQTPGIADITPLQNLTALRVLNVSSNQNIADITPLDGLTALESLNLDNNSIVELAALVVNSGIGAGDEVRVGGNPLSQTARCDELAILAGRGVNVTPTAAEVCTYGNRLVKAVLRGGR